MTHPSFARELLVAIGLSVVGALSFFVLKPWLGAVTGLRLVLLLMSLAYLCSLMQTLRLGSGRLLFGVVWLLQAGLLVWLDPSLWIWLLSQSLLIWLLRCVAHHGSPLPALLDAGLCLLALLAMVAAARQSHSLFWSLWSFFLVQALWVLLPGSFTTRTGFADAAVGPDAAFQVARRHAETALRRLTVR